MYQVTHFQKNLYLDNQSSYGSIVIYFGSNTSYKNTGRISITEFMALSHILENDLVAYDPVKKTFVTPVEKTKFVTPPNGPIV